MTCPLRSTSITPASSLLQGSPPLSNASVLSASRLEPLAPCMGLSESSRDLSTTPLSFFRPIPLFDRGDHPFVPTRASLTSARRSRQSWPPVIWNGGIPTALARNAGAAAINNAGQVVGNINGSAVIWNGGIPTVLAAAG